MRIIRIFDTTLRDGEQAPGCGMNVQEKLQVAQQLARLGVNIIEAGFAAASPGDFEAIKAIAGEIRGPVICSLARAREDDIRKAWEAIKDAPKKRIHTFHSTSDIHLLHQHKNMSRDEALKRSVDAVLFAKSFTDDVEFSPMDATRTDINYLCEVVGAVIEAGALAVNIPDTVGYTDPIEFGLLISTIRKRVKNVDQAVISVHCHNDLGMATANSLAAVRNGAGQIECTINGIGERAGNCSLEEVVMALRTRRDIFNADTNITTEEIMRSSRLITKITGMSVQPNKAIVGINAFAHEAGIHQDGLLKDKTTYEIIKPEDVGVKKTEFVLGKHSGRNALRTRLEELGYKLGVGEVNRIFEKFKVLADQKKTIYDEDLEVLVAEELTIVLEKFFLVALWASSSTLHKPSATVGLKVDGIECVETETGDGPVDAVFKAIAKMTHTKSKLIRYEVKAITGGTDAQGEVVVSLEENGRKARGSGADTDIIIASAKAYINALNKLAANGSK